MSAQPRFGVVSVHGYRILKNGESLNRRGAREPLPEWSVLDRAHESLPVACFVDRRGEEKATALAAALNAENEIARGTPNFEPDFQGIIDAATHAGKKGKSGRMRRNKGLRGEREVKLRFTEAGYTVRKLEDQGDHVVKGHPLGPLHVEAKRQEMLDIMRWMRQAEREADADHVPIVVFRRSREEWHVCLRLSDFLGREPDATTQA